MSGKIEISRELAQNIANYMEGSASGIVNQWHKELRAILAAPVVERQPVYQYRVHWNDIWFDTSKVEFDEKGLEQYSNTYITRTLYADQPAPVALVPDGWRLVPLHPTMDMLDALMDWNKVGNVNAYNNILNAAPACLDKVKELNQ